MKYLTKSAFQAIKHTFKVTVLFLSLKRNIKLNYQKPEIKKASQKMLLFLPLWLIVHKVNARAFIEPVVYKDLLYFHLLQF